MTSSHKFAVSDQESSELAPDGTLLVGIAVGPAASAVWAIRDGETGKPRGVTVSLATEIAHRCNLALKLVEFASSGEIVANAASGLWTLSFVPIDAERRKHVAVGPNYYLGVSTYLVRTGQFDTVEAVDRSGVRVIGIEGTATFRSAEKSLRKTTIHPIKSLDEAVALFQRGEADAVALGKESIRSLVRQIDGIEAAAGHFHEAGTAIIVPLGRSAALEAATRIIETLKGDGTIRSIFDANDMSDAEVAP